MLKQIKLINWFVRSLKDETSSKKFILFLNFGYIYPIKCTISISPLSIQKGEHGQRSFVQKSQKLEEKDLLSFQISINLSNKFSFYKNFVYQLETIIKMEEEEHLREAILNLFLKENNIWEDWIKFQQSLNVFTEIYQEESFIKLKFLIEEKIKKKRKIIGYVYDIDFICDPNQNRRKIKMFNQAKIFKKQSIKIMTEFAAFYSLHGLDKILHNPDNSNEYSKFQQILAKEGLEKQANFYKFLGDFILAHIILFNLIFKKFLAFFSMLISISYVFFCL